MAINFPDNPTIGDTYTSGQRTWRWDGVSWNAYGIVPDPTVLRVDSVNGRVGINNSSPAADLDVTGDAAISGDLVVTGDLTGNVTGKVTDISNHNLTDLGDVDMTTLAPSEGDIAYYDGANWVPYPFTVEANVSTAQSDISTLQSDVSTVQSDISTAQSDISTLQSAAGPGLVLISRTTIGNDVTSVTVSNAFSADYDNYRIILSGGVGTFGDTINMQLDSYAGQDYRYHYREMSFYSTSPGSAASNGFDKWYAVGQTDSTMQSACIDIYAPYIVTYTAATWCSAHSGKYVTGGGWLNQQKRITGFTLSTGQAGMVGGYIDVYGYAKA